ncbi:type IV pilin-like G/H family protein [Acaryochloris sp. IP29b_bin.137]|uniref:type IV pilin-like G/H family protein n=1 Tax=Acaryochloris sp. IP29b_bin.137 TaxID=2969217 RepID=UPI00262648D7|nr:type IV pilin-like G/H family protein [Acaryochloris sp. IP29b_bin.137]
MPYQSLRYPITLFSTAAAFLLLVSCSAENPTRGQSSENNPWEGTWELKDPASGETVTFVLQSDQKVYLITPDPTTAKDKVIEVPLTKVSDKTDLPENIKPVSLFDSITNQATKAREAAAKSELGAINRAQQAYRLENPTFASTYEELGIGRFDNEFYDINIVSADAQRAYVTATAKGTDTKSFSGVVTEEAGITKTNICETESPSQTPPPIDCE